MIFFHLISDYDRSILTSAINRRLNSRTAKQESEREMGFPPQGASGCLRAPQYASVRFSTLQCASVCRDAPQYVCLSVPQNMFHSIDI